MARGTAILLVFVAGCSFDTSGGAAVDEAPGGRIDAAPPSDAAVRVDAGPPDAALPDAAFDMQTLRVVALIDGRSRITIRRDTAQWRHLDFAAPGRHEGATEPTVVGGTEWLPQWPDVPDVENRNCNCDSDVLTGVSPALPGVEQVVELIEVDTRADVDIVQQPRLSNDFALIVEIDDRGPRGSFTFVFDLVFQGPP